MCSRCGVGAAQVRPICGAVAAQMRRRTNLQNSADFGCTQPWEMSSIYTYQRFMEEPAGYTRCKCSKLRFCESPVCANCDPPAAQVRPRCGISAPNELVFSARESAIQGSNVFWYLWKIYRSSGALQYRSIAIVYFLLFLEYFLHCFCNLKKNAPERVQNISDVKNIFMMY